MATPFEELAVRLEAADLHKVQEKRHELLGELNIPFEYFLQRLWNNAFLTLKTSVRVDLKISGNESP
jgi:hypothetical protein